MGKQADSNFPIVEKLSKGNEVKGYYMLDLTVFSCKTQPTFHANTILDPSSMSRTRKTSSP